MTGKMTTEEAIEYLTRCADGLDPDFDCAVSMAVSALSAQQTGGWISVKDRLPEIGEKVLTLDKWGHIHDRTLYQFDGIPKTTLFRPDGLAPGKDITHWQPLPEPPKGE